MKLLVSLCNRVLERFGDDRNVFLLRVDTSTVDVTPVRIPFPISDGATGMTGIARRPGGYVCVVGPSRLLYLSERLEIQEVFQLDLLSDGHGIAIQDGTCYVVSTGTDAILTFAPETGAKVFWEGTGAGTDTLHLNSILMDSRGCWASAFGPKAGPLWKSATEGYVLNVRTGERILSNIFHPHSLCAADGKFYLCESSRMTVRSTTGEALRVPHGYLRGLAISNAHMLVGCTKGRNRSKSTGLSIDNSADPGESAGKCGIAICGLDPFVDGYREESFIDLSAYADEIFDILVETPGESPD